MTKDFTRTLLHTAALILLFYSQVFSATIVTKQTLVVIDPGHRADDPGLTAPSGLRENTLAMELAHLVSRNLAKTCRTQLTHTAREPAPASERTAFANQEKADLFLSLHLQNSRSHQPMIFYFDLPNTTTTTDWQTRAVTHGKKSRHLAEAIALSYKQHSQKTRPIILSGPVSPLKGLGMPGILVESFSISQVPTDPDQRETFLADHATIISEAILKFLSAQGS